MRKALSTASGIVFSGQEMAEIAQEPEFKGPGGAFEELNGVKELDEGDDVASASLDPLEALIFREETDAAAARERLELLLGAA